MSGPSVKYDHRHPIAIGCRQTSGQHIRVDIQVMRALAIVSVLIHHARLPLLSAGFLGVDIFFVISGFLMTGLIDKGLCEGRFTFAGFYARRARRLLPAAYATLITVALLAPFLVDSSEYRFFAAQLAGAFGFVANIVLWRQSEYFGSGAALKPLLHMWSLSIEEQFYIVLPALLWFCPARLRLPLVSFVTLTSAALCIVVISRAPSFTFYALPTRCWELGFGAIVALVVRRGLVPNAPARALRFVCASVLVVMLFRAGEAGHPGVPAFIACAATAVLVVPGLDLRSPSLRPLAWIGDRSYSLYLVHWPIFSVASHIALGPVPAWVNASLILVCFGCTELQYRLVEQRFRTLVLDRRVVLVLFSIPLICVGTTYAASQALTTSETMARAGNPGLSPTCDNRDRFEDLAACRTAASAGTMVWGDSFAMALAPGLEASTPGGIVQATKTVCGPFLGIAPIDDGQRSARWGEGCLAFNRSVIGDLAKHPEIKTVVLTSAMLGYIPAAEDHDWHLLMATPAGAVEQDLSVTTLLEAIGRTAAAIHALGKHAVLVAPPPSIDIDMSRCLDRRAGHLPIVSSFPDCTFPRTAYERRRQVVLDVMARARAYLPVFSIDDALCRDGTCATQIDGVLLYRDASHLSRPGSVLLGRRFGWGAKLQRAAR